MQEIPEQGRWREPILPGVTRRREEILWARCRPPQHRTPKPQPGQAVGLRLQPYGPVLKATIVEVYDQPPVDTRPGREIDWNVWRFKVLAPDKALAAGPRRLVDRSLRGDREIELVDDPWWDCLVSTVQNGVTIRVRTREARLPGDPGYLLED